MAPDHLLNQLAGKGKLLVCSINPLAHVGAAVQLSPHDTRAPAGVLGGVASWAVWNYAVTSLYSQSERLPYLDAAYRVSVTAWPCRPLTESMNPIGIQLSWRAAGEIAGLNRMSGQRQETASGFPILHCLRQGNGIRRA